MARRKKSGWPSTDSNGAYVQDDYFNKNLPRHYAVTCGKYFFYFAKLENAKREKKVLRKACYGKVAIKKVPS